MKTDKAQEIEIEFGFEGQMLWPPGSPVAKVSSKKLFREVLSIPKNEKEINTAHLIQLSEELIHKNPSGAMYVSPQIIHELIMDSQRQWWLIETGHAVEKNSDGTYCIVEVTCDYPEHLTDDFKTPTEAIDAGMKADV